MQKHREIPWPRIVAEGAAIVISILLAFGIQAWWDAVVEQDREREILTALSDDFNQTRTNLIDGINFHTAVQDRNQKLLAAITGSKKALCEAEFDRLLLDLSWWDSYYPFTTGGVNSVISGGELAIIGNDELRRMIADWPTKIALVESNRSQDYDFFRDIWMPFLRQKGFVPQISEINARAPGRPQLLSTVAGLPISNRKSMSSIIVDDEFLNILFQKRWVQADILVQFTEAIRQVDKIEKLINAELEKGN